MIKHYGKLMCFNGDDGKKHIFAQDDTSSLCGKQKAVLRRNYYGKKTYILWRSLDAVSCDECKKLYNYKQCNC